MRAMRYEFSSQFEYRYRRPSFGKRLRRSVQRQLRQGKTFVAVVGVSGVVGYVALNYLTFLSKATDESINRSLDQEYRKAGVEPTRDKREREMLRERVGKYQEAQRLEREGKF